MVVLVAGRAPYLVNLASARLDVGVLARLLPLKCNPTRVAVPGAEFEANDRRGRCRPQSGPLRGPGV